MTVQGASQMVPTLYDELAPIRWLLFLYMLWPITRNNQGVVVAPWIAHTTCFIGLMYVVQSCWNVNVLSSRVALVVDHAANINELVYFSIFVILLLGHWLIPVIYWPEARQLARYFNSWASFQEEYAKVTGHPLRLGLLPRVTKVALLCTLLPLLSVVPTYLNPDVPLYHSLIYICVAVYFFLIGASWNFLCTTIDQVALRTKNVFRKEVQSGRITPGSVRAYCGLWCQLRQLTSETGSAQSISMLYFVVYCTVLSLVTGFSCIIDLSSNRPASMGIGQSILALRTLWFIHLVHDSGHKAVATVSVGMQNELLRVNFKGDDKLCQEVRVFLRTIASNPVEISLGGFTKCSRSGCILVFNALLLNLLVLMQIAFAGNGSSASSAERANNVTETYE